MITSNSLVLPNSAHVCKFNINLIQFGWVFVFGYVFWFDQYDQLSTSLVKDEIWKNDKFAFVLPASKQAPCVWIANGNQKEESVRMFTQSLAVLQARLCEVHVATPGKLLRCMRQLCARNSTALEQLV